MVERSKHNFGQVVRVLSILLLIGLGWRVFSLGMADAESRMQPDKALQWRVKQSTALFLLAERQVKNPATKKLAQTNALAALHAYPLEGRAYRVLGQLAEAEKNPEQAYEFFQRAVKYSPRDLESHLWLMNYALRTENAEAAILHLDRLLRMREDLLAQLVPTVAGLAVHPGSQSVLIRYLEKRPAWRTQVVRSMSTHTNAAQLYADFFNRLAKSHGGMNEVERQAWLNALNQSQQWPLAYLNWAAGLSAAQQRELGNLFNGSFENEPLGSEFDWQFERIPGAVVDRVVREDAHGDLALKVSFDGRRVPFGHVKQTLVLPAGRYRLSGKGIADNLRTEIGLVWSIQCMGKGDSLAVSRPLKGHSQAWEAFTLDFEVPPSECPAQSLQLKLPAQLASEQEISGIVWFDALRIQKIQALTEQGTNK